MPSLVTKCAVFHTSGSGICIRKSESGPSLSDREVFYKLPTLISMLPSTFFWYVTFFL